MLLMAIPNLLLAQKVDSAALRSHQLYYWGAFNLGGGWGAVGRSEGTGISYGLSATALYDHNFIRIKAAGSQSFDNMLTLIGSKTGSNYKNYDLLFGRQFPFGPRESFSLATGVAHLKYHSEDIEDIAGSTPLEYTNNGIPIEITFMHSSNSFLGGTLSFELIFNNKNTMGNVTIGIMLGRIREKIVKDKKP